MPRTCRLTVDGDRLELLDGRHHVAIARRAAGTDVWIVSRPGRHRVEQVDGELAARARLDEIAEER